MNIKNNKLRAIILGLLIIISVFGYTTPAFADEPPYQPNYGEPITVDGNLGDWDLDIDGPDHFVFLYRLGNSDDVVEADAYLRFDSDSGVLYILVLSRNGQNVRTVNDQYVMVDQFDPYDPQNDVYQDVNEDDALPAGELPCLTEDLPCLAWVNPNATVTITDGWEAAIVWEDAIDPERTDHRIAINTLVLLDNGSNSKGYPDGDLFGFIPIEVNPYDYGDLPDSYGTTNYNAATTFYGPKHTAGALRLGVQVDGETDGQPDSASLDDDATSRNDEDGITPFGNWWTGIPEFRYTVNGCTGSCYLNAWVDWNNNGTFDADETLFTNRLVSDADQATPYQFSLPVGVTNPPILNFRFRLCDVENGCATPHALSAADAPFGEVEDYQWTFAPNAISLNSFSAKSLDASTNLLIIAGFFALTVFGGAVMHLGKRKMQSEQR